MNAHIITGLNSGLGDMYSNIYRVYDVQQQLNFNVAESKDLEQNVAKQSIRYLQKNHFILIG